MIVGTASSSPAAAVQTTPAVSVIIPCYNGSRFLRATLDSVLAQTRRAAEVLVVDDGSTDESAAIAQAYGPPIRVLRQPNRGESAARNRALAEAAGTHVLFLDADDLLERDALARLSSAVEGRPGVVALMGCGWFTDDPEAPHTVKHLVHAAFFPDIIVSNFGPPNCWLAPLDVVRAAGGFAEDMRWFEDWDLWWRVGLHAAGLVCVPYVGAKYRQHPHSQLATTKPADRARGHAALLTRMTAAFIERPELLQRHGDSLFWSVWTAIARARAAGVSWRELRHLTTSLRRIARSGPASVTRSPAAWMFRLVGARLGFALQRWRRVSA